MSVQPVARPHLATVTTTLRHTVRLVHASTGARLRGLDARLEPAPAGWTLRVLPDVLVVSTRADAPVPATLPKVVVTLTDGALADVLVVPPVAGRPPRTMVIDLDAAEIEHVVHPVPMTLTVVLTTPSTGAPRTGATVTARATSGPNPRPSVALPEVAPGTYRSAAVEWTAAFTPLDVLVGGQPLRTLAVDVSTSTTTVHLVDTT
ncbi:hypothetical protein LJR027_003833 [Terrabacter sp. LjRoot27]|uniref:hypothetical protein n=1 Tax=Terrabacter sp. LjRoot27 TaxID=3342306 RepID=UPI003ECF0DBC